MERSSSAPIQRNKDHSACSSGVVLIWTFALLTACVNSERPSTHVPEDRALSAISGASELPVPTAVRFVKFEQLTEINGKPWASVAEFGLFDSTGAVINTKLWTVTADSAGTHDSASNAIDGNPATLWHTSWNETTGSTPPPHALVVDLGRATMISGFRYLPRQDSIDNGTIAKYRLYLSNDGLQWGMPVSEGDFSGSHTAGIEKVVTFTQVTANRSPSITVPPAQNTVMGKPVAFQVAASDLDGDQLTYSCSGLPVGLHMSPATGLITGTAILPGDHVVSLVIVDDKGAAARSQFDWTVQSPVSAASTQPAAPGEVRFVRLDGLSEVNGKPWASVAELALLDARGASMLHAVWSASADSADTSDRPSNSIDGNPTSIWHTQWDSASPPPPHSLIIDLGTPKAIHGFRYLPRQDGSMNGTIAKFQFFTSRDGVVWGKPVASGDFSTMGAITEAKTVLFNR